MTVLQYHQKANHVQIFSSIQFDTSGFGFASANCFVPEESSHLSVSFIDMNVIAKSRANFVKNSSKRQSCVK